MNISKQKKAIVLLSGGIDSATCLFIARKTHKCHCLIFDYGQRHRREIRFAESIAQKTKSPYRILKLSLPWGGTALLDKGKRLPQDRRLSRIGKDIPPTYVPGRNIIFLSIGISWAEVLGASYVYIGAHQSDFSGYPDCRKDFFEAFQKAIIKGTKAGVEGKEIEIVAPLLDKTKSEIVKMGKRLGVPFELTWSCYKGGKRPCGRCDSCILREKGFKEAGIEDPLIK